MPRALAWRRISTFIARSSTLEHDIDGPLSISAEECPDIADRDSVAEGGDIGVRVRLQKTTRRERRLGHPQIAHRSGEPVQVGGPERVESAIRSVRAPVMAHACKTDAPTLSPATATTASRHRRCSSSVIRYRFRAVRNL